MQYLITSFFCRRFVCDIIRDIRDIIRDISNIIPVPSSIHPIDGYGTAWK